MDDIRPDYSAPGWVEWGMTADDARDLADRLEGDGEATYDGQQFRLAADAANIAKSYHETTGGYLHTDDAIRQALAARQDAAP